MMRVVDGIYIADGVVISGDVVLHPGVNLWYGTVIRGDIARITLGPRVNIQDGCILHTDFDVPLDIEEDVVVGHAAIVHCRRVGRGTLVGMGSSLLSRAVIGEGCIIAAGAVVTEDKTIPPRSLVVGIPGRVVRSVTDEELAKTKTLSERYRELAVAYASGTIAWPYGPPTAAGQPK